MIHPVGATFPETLHENPRMLELRTHIEATTIAPSSTATQLPVFASSNVPFSLKEANYALRMVVAWRIHSKEQEDRIEALIWDVNSLFKETKDKNLIIVKQKVELEHLHALVKERTATMMHHNVLIMVVIWKSQIWKLMLLYWTMS